MSDEAGRETESTPYGQTVTDRETEREKVTNKKRQRERERESVISHQLTSAVGLSGCSRFLDPKVPPSLAQSIRP